MDKELLFKECQEYKYFNNMHLDLESFCITLSSCFVYDNNKDLAPQPRVIYDLLIDLINEEVKHQSNSSNNSAISNYNNDKKLIRRKTILEMNETIEKIYPNGYITYVSLLALLPIFHKWIAFIGYELIGLPEDKENRMYYAWAKPEWKFVFTFINGFHDAITNVMKNVDRKSSIKNGYSAFEALANSTNDNITFDEAVENLKKRNSVHLQTLEKIKKAIDSKFYLEAITLEECLISNCLYNYLNNKKKIKSTLTLHKILDQFEKYDNINIVDQIHKWRKNRNKAIHEYVNASIEDISKTTDQFEKFSEDTADKGLNLSIKILRWFERESPNTLKTNFFEKE